MRCVVQRVSEAYVTVDGREFARATATYTQEELTEKAHNYELVPCDSTVLCIDYAQNGVGSNSCGPKLLEKYHLPEKVDFHCVITL